MNISKNIFIYSIEYVFRCSKEGKNFVNYIKEFIKYTNASYLQNVEIGKSHQDLTLS